MKALFLTDLHVHKIDHRHWRLTQPLQVQVSPGVPHKDGRCPDLVEVPVGFETDFASVPRTPLCWWIGGGIGDKSAVVHDYFCVYRELVSSQVAADLFEACLRVEIGVPGWRRAAMVKAVRLFGPRF